MSISGFSAESSNENPPTSANSVRIWVPVTVATWPPWKVLSWASSLINRPLTPP